MLQLFIKAMLSLAATLRCKSAAEPSLMNKCKKATIIWNY